MDNLTAILICLSILLFITLIIVSIKYRNLHNTYTVIEDKICQTAKRDYYFALYYNRASTIEILETIINDIKRYRSDSIELRQKFDKDHYFSIERIVLLTKLIDSDVRNQDRFYKTKFDDNLVALNKIFYLYYYCKNQKLYKWEIDIQYWDLFKVNIHRKDGCIQDGDGKDLSLSTNIEDVY